MTAEFLDGLDPLEIMLVRKKLEAILKVSADATSSAPVADLFNEMASLLYLLELAVWQRHDQVQSFNERARSRHH
jgi:hypothetical protein